MWLSRDRKKYTPMSFASLVVFGAMLAVQPSAARALETRSYAFGWFTQAMNSQEGDCPGGIHPPMEEQYRRNLIDLGVSKAEAARLIEGYVAGGPEERIVFNMMLMRGRIDGKPVNGYAHPGAVVDPQLTHVTAKEGYGFNLDGKEGPMSFVDPLTRETGVDHQLSRAFGCSEPFRGTYDNRPGLWLFRWSTMRDTTPAWLMTLEGESLDVDGPIEIIFERAMSHLRFNGDGEPRADLTYRVDPDPRSRTRLKGEIKDGMIWVTEHGRLRLQQDILGGGQLILDRTHMRLSQRRDGSLDGFLAGYQPWELLYFQIAQGASASEAMSTGELPGKYHLMRKLADYDPDPVTGQNRAISVTYRIELVPAFIARKKDGQWIVEDSATDANDS